MGDQPKKEEPMRSVAEVSESAEPLVPLGTKVRESTRKRLRRYAVEADVEMQQVVDMALDQYLRDRGH